MEFKFNNLCKFLHENSTIFDELIYSLDSDHHNTFLSIYQTNNDRPCITNDYFYWDNSRDWFLQFLSEFLLIEKDFIQKNFYLKIVIAAGYGIKNDNFSDDPGLKQYLKSIGVSPKGHKITITLEPRPNSEKPFEFEFIFYRNSETLKLLEFVSFLNGTVPFNALPCRIQYNQGVDVLDDILYTSRCDSIQYNSWEHEGNFPPPYLAYWGDPAYKTLHGLAPFMKNNEIVWYSLKKEDLALLKVFLDSLCV